MSEKNLDKKGRWRKRIVAVRMSDETVKKNVAFLG